jgi:hypothetical protein
MSVTYAYAAEIVKSERDANGDLLVYGKATGPDLDLDGQICDPTWLKSAMPAWMEWGNVREMHQPIAAGVGVELEAIGDDWWLKSKCIDPGTAAKIESGVLKGYSIGIKNPKVIKDATAPAGRIVGGAIVETSYVDRPCNPTAKMAICKAAKDGTLQPVEAPETPEVGDADAVVPLPGGAGDAPAAPAADLGLKRQGADMVRRVRKLVPELVTLDKAAPAADIASARAAISAIARLIESEAASLAEGEVCDAYQISCLLDAVASLEWFCELELSEATSDALDLAGAVDVDLAVTPDDTKTAGNTPDESTITAMITKAVTEATEASEGRVRALEAQLAKVTATPIPGGPVLARPVQSIAAAEGRSTALAKAAEYERRASEMRGVDHAAAQGYLDLAAQERARVKA